MILHKDELFCLWKILQLCIQPFDRLIIIGNICVLINRVTRVIRQIRSDCPRLRTLFFHPFENLSVIRKIWEQFFINLFISCPHLLRASVQTYEKIQTHTKNRECKHQYDPWHFHRWSLIHTVKSKHKKDCHDSCCPVNNSCVFTYLCEQKEKEYNLQQDRYCCEDQPLCSVLCLFLSFECTAAQIYMPLFSFPFNNCYFLFA